MLRNQWDLGIYLNMALLKVEQGHFETAILILHNFFVFYYGYRGVTSNVYKTISAHEARISTTSTLRSYISAMLLALKSLLFFY